MEANRLTGILIQRRDNEDAETDRNHLFKLSSSGVSVVARLCVLFSSALKDGHPSRLVLVRPTSAGSPSLSMRTAIQKIFVYLHRFSGANEPGNGPRPSRPQRVRRHEDEEKLQHCSPFGAAAPCQGSVPLVAALPCRVHPWLLLFLLSSSSLAQSPVVNRTQPLALAPGKTTALTLIGERLVPGGTLWTSFKARIADAESLESASTFNITLSSNVPPGIGALQLANSNGVSNVRLVMIDSLQSLVDTGTNTSAANAQSLPFSTAVDGHCDELESHFYRIQLGHKQRVVIEVVANRIGSLLDPFLRVLDVTGHELATVDDTPGCGADGRIEFTASRAGAYLIEVRDTRYTGGPNFFYRLRLGGFAAEPWRFLALATPLAGPTPNAPPVHIERETEVKTSQSPKPSQRKRTQSSRTESKNLLTPAAADVIQPPVLIQGHFDFPGDQDVFEFAAQKDERWIIHGRTRSLGAPCDLYLRLEKPDGSRIAEADATGADEGNLTNKITETGSVHLVVEELNHSGGSGFDYQIEITPYDPGFTLNVGTNSIEAAPGGTFELKVNAARRDFDGPITLSLAGLGEGFSMTNHVITEKQPSITTVVTLSATLKPGRLVHFAVVGSAEAGSQRIESRASTLPSLKGEFPQMLYPPRELDGLIWLGVKSESVAPK